MEVFGRARLRPSPFRVPARTEPRPPESDIITGFVSKGPGELDSAGERGGIPAGPGEGFGATPDRPPALGTMHKRGIGVMPSQSRNISEQEQSIKLRSHELFVEPVPPADGTKPTKPFPVYSARDARPAVLDLLTRRSSGCSGSIVAVLFLAALWRISHHQRRRSAGAARPRCQSRPDRPAIASRAGPQAGLPTPGAGPPPR